MSILNHYTQVIGFWDIQSPVLPSTEQEGRTITYWRRQTEQERAELAARLRQARKEADLDQREVARRLGIPQSTISELENGQRKLDMAELKCLASLYSKPPGWFLSDPSHELCEKSPMVSGIGLLRLGDAANAHREARLTTALRQEDVEALDTIACLSGYTTAKVMWLGDVHLLHSKALISLVFGSRDMKAELLAALRRQSCEPSTVVSDAAASRFVVEVLEVRVEHCQARPDFFEFGGWMILRFEAPSDSPQAERRFDARMSKTRDIGITWTDD